MASVWLGRQASAPDQLVALKVIRAEHGNSSDFVAMFQDEARIASRLSHPNIIAVVGFGHDGRRHFIAMEPLRGRTLLEVWEAARLRGRRLPYEAVAWIGARVADALHHAHELCDEKGALLQVVHRDVNPSNIFLTLDGVPKLIDFGLARALDRTSSTATGIIKGKLAYLAPEQAHQHPFDRRADVFALGITLWEVSLDRRLFKEDADVDTVRRVREAQVRNPTAIDAAYPPALANVITRALARDPRDRFATAGELRDGLDAFARSGECPVDKRTVAKILRELFGEAPPALWEKLVANAAPPPGGRIERIQAWDDERQKFTWMQASVQTLIPQESLDEPRDDAGALLPWRERLDGALVARLASLERCGDRVARSRAHLERAIVDEALGEAAQTASHARASLNEWGTSVAHGALRRQLQGAQISPSLLEHLDFEIASCGADSARADLLAERARLLQAMGESPAAVRAAWVRALQAGPGLPAALGGLERALWRDLEQSCDHATRAAVAEALATHLGRTAGIYDEDPRLCAWLHVERAHLAEQFAEPSAAKVGLTRALELDSGIGPVRSACVAHAVEHRDADWLVTLLAEQANLEEDPSRAARLELDAACLARLRLGDGDRALALLERAAARASGVSSLVRRRTLDELVSQYEAAGRTSQALGVRRSRLAYFEEPRGRAHELRAIAYLEESLGDREAAIASFESALKDSPSDTTLVEALDRLLERASLTDRRIELWARHSASAERGPDRARRLVRAAQLAEASGDGVRSAEYLRAALVACPTDSFLAEQLLRLLAFQPTEPERAEARARIAVHAHAAEHSRDPGRRIAHLEALALLQEEMLGDPALAATTYETILRYEPGRRGALLGLARAAARAADWTKLARALLDEAALTTDLRAANALRVEAAMAIGSVDPERALALAEEVLQLHPDHADALALAQRLHEGAGRWAQADVRLAARIDHATQTRERVELLLARADLQRTRLRSVPDAIASVRAAMVLDSGHPAARETMRQLLDATDDPAAQLSGLEELAATATALPDRLQALVRAADIAEHVLLDDARAAELYARACADPPGDPWIEDRRLRVMRRLSRTGPLQELRSRLTERLDRQPNSGARAFELALVLLDEHADLGRIGELLEVALREDPSAPHALRTLERVARASHSESNLASALARQARSFQGRPAKLAALWAHADLAQWGIPEAGAEATIDRILENAPDDRAALDATLRLAWPKARAGDKAARTRVVAALAARLAQASDDTERLWANLSIALLCDPDSRSAEGLDAPTALAHYFEALRIDPRSVVAALGTERLGNALGDSSACIAATTARADLETDAKLRAALLVRASGHVLSATKTLDGEAESREGQLASAGALLERALEADPESLAAMGLLSAVRSEEGPAARDRLRATLRSAFDRAHSRAVVIALGTEVARVACLEPPDRMLAIEALRRVLVEQPAHAPALRALADQYLAQRAWGEAIDTLQALANELREPHAKIATLFELADLLHDVLGQTKDADRVLVSALDVDPTSVIALQRLLEHRSSTGAPKTEIARLLSRLAEAQAEPAAKADTLDRLGQVHSRAGSLAEAKQALVEATALAPTPERLKRLILLCDGSHQTQVETLLALQAREEQLGRPYSGSYAELGRLEGKALGRWDDAVTHLRQALALDPTAHEARVALAEALEATGQRSEASALLLSMISPESAPLMALADPLAAISALEQVLAAQGRTDEAVVLSELRALGGGLGKGTYVEPPARRLAPRTRGPSPPVPLVFDAAALRSIFVPADCPSLLFDLSDAIAGVQGKIVRSRLEELGIDPRERLPPASSHPLASLGQRLSAALGIGRVEIAVTGSVTTPQAIVNHDVPWLAVPKALLTETQSLQIASLVRPLMRLGLSVAWLEGLSPANIRAVFCGAARQVVPGYANDPRDNAQERELLDETARRIARAIGRPQKKALAALAQVLGSTVPPTLADVRELQRALARAELRAAYVFSGDLFSPVALVRAADREFAAALDAPGGSAIRSLLSHPLAGDLARFALGRRAIELRAKTRPLADASA